MLYAAVLKYEKKLPTGFSVAVLFAIAAVESGGNNPAYQNSTTQGGAFQIRKESNHLSMPQGYPDTPQGYEQNVVDAIATINDNYGYALNSMGEGTHFHYLYTKEYGYPNNPNEVTAARTVLYYNGGTGWQDKINNPYSYWKVPENKPYVGNVAGMLEGYVPKNFGFSDDTLINILKSVQADVNATIK
jgi:hypothetical protein